MSVEAGLRACRGCVGSLDTAAQQPPQLHVPAGRGLEAHLCKSRLNLPLPELGQPSAQSLSGAGASLLVQVRPTSHPSMPGKEPLWAACGFAHTFRHPWSTLTPLLQPTGLRQVEIYRQETRFQKLLQINARPLCHWTLAVACWERRGLTYVQGKRHKG